MTSPRFLSRAEVANELNISSSQVYALIRRGELRGIKIGGRGTWRTERTELEAYIERAYGETSRWARDRPFVEHEADD